MEIPIEKKRLFRILDDLANNFNFETGSYVFSYGDSQAVQILADMGFVELRSGGKILDHTDDIKETWDVNEKDEKVWAVELVKVHLKSDFLTQVGLALFREHDEDTN